MTETEATGSASHEGNAQGPQGYPYADIELSRRLERAEGHSNAKFIEARARVFPEYESEWIEIVGTYAMFDGACSPVTQTFGLGLFGNVTITELDRLEKFFQERGAPVYHEVSPLSGLPLVTLLNERGYQPVEFTNVLFRPLPHEVETSYPESAIFRVRPIGNDEGDVFAETAVKGWCEFPELREYLQELGPISAHREDAISFLAESDSQPVAAGVLCMAEGVALLGGACTVPEARRQGAQRALLDARLKHASQSGCDLAMICALPGSASQRNAERHGFHIAYTRTKWQLVPGVGNQRTGTG